MLALLLGTLLTLADPLPESVVADAHVALATLPGHTGFAFTELTEDGPVLLAGVRQDENFAVGSTFKLFILGTLADDVNNDRRQLDSIMRLEAEVRRTACQRNGPVARRFTGDALHAGSDDLDQRQHRHRPSALSTRSRTRIEQMMPTMGSMHPQWNRPLLSTREMTQLRDKKTGMPAGVPNTRRCRQWRNPGRSAARDWQL